ncbi:DUF2325 domain-containing protein [[Brevibacterium] frigoritolerans]|nr:DUF2325 domain-containing protein [Peribacillus frigoritolerans]
MAKNYFDAIHPLIWALGSCERLHQEITLRYQQNEGEYYRYYKESEFYNDPLFQSVTTKNMEMMKMVTGIVLKERESKKNDVIIKLIKKGFKETYNFVMHRTYVDMDELMVKNTMKGMQEGDSDSLLHNLGVAIYLATELGKDFDEYSLMFQRGVQTLQLQTTMYRDEDTFIKEQVEKYRHLIQSEKEDLHILDKKELLISEITFSQTMIDSFENFTLRNDEDFLKQYFQDGFTKYLSGIDSFTRSLGINSRDLFRSVKVKQEQIDVVLAHFHYLVGEGQLDESEKNVYLAYSLFILAMSEEYKQTREKYLEQMKDKFYYELNKIQNEINEQQAFIIKQKEELKEKKAEMKKEKTALEYTQKQLLKELEEYKLKVQHLENKQEKAEGNTKELFALREHLFSLQDKNLPDVEINENRLKEMTDVIMETKIVVVGGHPQWQNKVKETFKDISFISADERGRDFSFLDKADVVIINTSYNSHSLYKRVMNQLNKNNVPIGYIHQSTNIDLLIPDLFDTLKDNKLVMN